MLDSLREVVGLSDRQVLFMLDMAKRDLTLAAEQQPNSEWHEACFAATIVYAREASRRGLDTARSGGAVCGGGE